MAEPEKKLILAALQANAWNRVKAAKSLNRSRTTLYKKMRRFGLSYHDAIAEACTHQHKKSSRRAGA
ncbi:MAG TPA: helix-turn-helix domain-containing protein [Sedimentisphaerales bacterium]|nr:helix-turn-helix domain-containing protein [Sedimentisphaerales bacterium]